MIRGWLRLAATERWARLRAPVAGACGLLAGAACAIYGGAPGRSLATFAQSLGQAIGAARVQPADLRWEPSHGAFADLVVGRWLLFLARSAKEETRDLWRARVRLAPDGSVLQIAELHDLTNTPLGDEHELVVLGQHAAFATRAYGQEQGVTLLALGGEGPQNKNTRPWDQAMAVVTNLQRTGEAAGIGRVQLTLEAPSAGVGLLLGDEALEISVVSDSSRRASQSSARFDLGSGEIVPASSLLHADPSVHLPKRFSHWLVDTLRAVPWIGPKPIAWLEDQALAARDSYRRMTFFSGRDSTDVAATAEALPPPLDTSRASFEEAHWPPQAIPTIWKVAEPGEGAWVTPDISWLRRMPNIASTAPAPFAETFVRPDRDRPYSKVFLVAMDTRQMDLGMQAGVEDPEPLTGPPGLGRIPRDPLIYRRVAAAFNGAFKTDHGHYGMMVDRRVLLPPVPGSATVVVLNDGRAGFGTWGAQQTVGGIVGVADDEIVSFRQNLDPLVDQGLLNPTGRNLWGFTLPGKGAQTERSGLCVTTAGHLLYAWGDDLSATTLGRALQMAGCAYALHLDMNPYHTGFVFTAIDELPRKYKVQLLTPGMSIAADRFIQYAPKDFFYVVMRDPAPPAVQDGSPWTPDDGTQPPPSWLPGVWQSHLDGIELVDIEPGRVTWRLRAGTTEAALASPLRELLGDEAQNVLFSAGMGVGPEQHPLGLATGGRIAVAPRGDGETGLLVIGREGQIAIEQADAAASGSEAEDFVELPVVLWDSHLAPAAGSATNVRIAIGIAPGGRVILARGSVSTARLLGRALARAGCTRALLLDRGVRATGFLDRSGGASPPRGKYPETVLYAIGALLRPRAFRFESTVKFDPPMSAR